MAAAVSSSACRYCHGDLVLMYLPANRVADDEAEKQTAPHKASEGETQEDSGNKDDEPSAKKASSGELPAVQADALPLTRMLRPKDTDCHVLGVVSQGQHEAISVKVLTPLGPAYNGKGAQGVEEGQDSAFVYNPATGRPYGFLLPRDRCRLLKLVKALNAQHTKWTVQRIMSLTTLHREFQVCSSCCFGDCSSGPGCLCCACPWCNIPFRLVSACMCMPLCIGVLVCIPGSTWVRVYACSFAYLFSSSCVFMWVGTQTLVPL